MTDTQRKSLPLPLLGLLPFIGGLLIALVEWNVNEKGLLSMPMGDFALTGDEREKLIELPAIYGPSMVAAWSLAAWALSKLSSGGFKSSARCLVRCFAPLSIGLVYIVWCRFTDGDKGELPVGRLVWIIALAWTTANLAGALWRETSERFASRRWRVVLLSAILALAAGYAVLFSVQSLRRHKNFHSNMHDQGLYDQIMWCSIRGDVYRCTQWQIPGQYNLKQYDYNFLAEHFMLILIPLMPFYAVWQSPYMLLLVQTLALAGASLLLYAFATRALQKVPDDDGGNALPVSALLLAFALAVSFLLHPKVQLTNVKEFHADALEPICIFLAAWALVARRPYLYGLGLLLAMSCKEDVSMSVAAFGLFLAVFTKRRMWGVWTFVAGAVWYVAVIKFAMPHLLRDGDHLRHLYRYENLVGDTSSGGVGAILKALALHPIASFIQVADAERLFSALILFAPVAFLPLRRPQTLIICAPSVAACLLSDWPIQHGLDLHYAIAILPWIYVAAIMSLWEDGGIWPKRAPSRHALFSIACFVLILSAMSTMHFGRAMGIGGEYSPYRYHKTGRYENAVEAIAAVPPKAAVSANTNLGAHLTRRRDIYQFPTIENAEYVLLDVHQSSDPRKDAATFPMARDDYYTSVTQLIASPEWDIEREWLGDYILFRRTVPAD